MHIELGVGHQTIQYCNPDMLRDIDEMFTRIATAYSTMLCMGYPEINRIYKNSKIIFTDETASDTLPAITLSSRARGIYIAKCAYSKRIARELYIMTGLPIFTDPSQKAIAEIGLGGMDVKTEGYIMLKDAMLALPNRLF